MVKTIFLGLVGAFVIFYIVTSPDHAADIANGIGHLARDVAHGVGDFINKIGS